MKLTKCDQCGIQDQAEEIYGTPPKGWYSLRSNDYTVREQHLCSLTCVITRAEALQIQIMAAQKETVA